MAILRDNYKKPAASCRSNLKQMGLAIKMYISDWDIRWPGKWKPEWAVEEILEPGVKSNNTEGVRILFIF